MGKFRKFFLTLLILLVITSGTWFFLTYCEGEKPVITIDNEFNTIGAKKSFQLICTDAKTGLQNISVTIRQDGKDYAIANWNFPEKGVKRNLVKVEINTRELKLKEGDAVLQISAGDHSLRKNNQTKSWNITVDTVPPQIFLLSTAHYINPGGSCLAVYRLSEDAPRNGVYVDKFPFSSYALPVNNNTTFLSFFAIPSDVNRKTVKIGIQAEDKAGNTSYLTIPFHIRTKQFRNDPMNISKSFLENKMPEFQQRYPELRNTELSEVFRHVNSNLRAEDNKRIQTICGKSNPSMLWDGVFLRMNAATMATFGERRTYYYGKQKIGSSTHLGIDLASIQNAPVEAANNGIVVYSGYLGIYGNTVIIDHGMGIFSLYAHLSIINVQEGQSITKGMEVGKSGMSGLAGGDHLHFSILVGSQFVNPLEWWDSHWIQDNILKKLAVSF